MTDRRGDAEFGAEKRRTQLGDQLFPRIGVATSRSGEVAIEASGVTRPVTQSGIPGFPEPVIIRNMIFWRKDEVQQLEDALMKFEGRGRFEADRSRAKRAVIIERELSKVKRPRRAQRKNDESQLHLF